MKKSILMLAALSLGTVAVAQMPSGSAQPTPPDGAMPAPPMTPAPSTPPMAGTGAMPMDPAAPSAPTTPAAPDAAASTPMAPPAGGGGAMSGGMPMASTDTSNYPVCSKKVQDKCINTSAAPHKAMRHKR